MSDDDIVFKALADPTRRFLLDLLFQRDGQTLGELEGALEMSRFGVMKHLSLLEEANLIVTQKSGRKKFHFLNPVPIQLIHERWIRKYALRQVSALTDLKTRLEEKNERKRIATNTDPPDLYQMLSPTGLGSNYQARVD